jgi:hypothetical protein
MVVGVVDLTDSAFIDFVFGASERETERERERERG